MKKFSFFLFILAFTTLMSASSGFADDYQHSIDLKSIKFFWSVEAESLRIRLVGKTKGWVAIGFNPTSQMKNANIIIGYVKKGKVKISDEFGTTRTKHKSDTKLKGKKNLKSTSGSEKKGVTTLNFTIPLNSGDKNDGIINPEGNTRVIVATGKRDSFRFGHNFQATLDVDLSSGKFQMK